MWVNRRRCSAPSRWGSLIGLIGGLVFISTPVLGVAVATVAWAAGLALVLAALFAHYARPVSLGPPPRPRPVVVGTHGACVVGEIALIGLGSRALTAEGRGDLRPALIATVVGLHFIPFAWAFGERMFDWLGDLLVVLGAAGLVAGGMGVEHAAETLAVLAGLAMLVIMALDAMGLISRVAGAAGERSPTGDDPLLQSSCSCAPAWLRGADFGGGPTLSKQLVVRGQNRIAVHRELRGQRAASGGALPKGGRPGPCQQSDGRAAGRADDSSAQSRATCACQVRTKEK